MKNKITLFLVGFLFFTFLQAYASPGDKFFISAPASINPSNIFTCQSVDTFQFRMLNITTGNVGPNTVTYTMPAGVNYIPGSVFLSATPSGSSYTITEFDISNLNAPIFSVSTIIAGDEITVAIPTNSDCGVLSNTSMSNSIRIDYTGNFDELSAGGYSANNPSIITLVDQTNINAQFGGNYLRTFTLRQSGNGFLREAYFERTIASSYVVDSLNLVGFGNVPFTLLSGASEDTIRIHITNAMLVAAGITDSTFDQNDEIDIINYERVVDCAGGTGGSAVGYWGCGPEICEKLNAVSIGFLFGSFTPDLTRTLYQEDELGLGLTWPTNSSCQSSVWRAALIRNTGNETAIDLSFRLLVQASLYYGGIDTSAGIYYQYGLTGTPVRIDSLYNFNNRAPNNAYPTSFCNGGQTNTIYYLNAFAGIGVEVGDSVYISWKQTNCANDFDAYPSMTCGSVSQSYYNLGYRIDELAYTDPCGIINYNEGGLGGTNGLYNRFLATSSGPSNIFAGDVETTSYNANSTSLSWFSTSLYSDGRFTSSGYIDLSFDLPEGLDYAGDPTNLSDPAFAWTDPDGTVWEPDTIIYSDATGNSKFTARFYPPRPAAFNYTTNMTVDFSYVADCSEIPPCPSQINPVVTITSNWYGVPDTSCPSKYYLDCPKTTDPIQVFCNFCEPCPLGVAYRDAGIERITFGTPDNNQDGYADTLANGMNQPADSLDFNVIARKKYITGDELQGRFSGIINTTAGSLAPGDSVNVMPFLYGQISLPSSDFEVLRGFVSIFDASSGITHNSTTSTKVFQQGTDVYSDLSYDSLDAYASMVPPLPVGFVYEQDDSVTMTIDVKAIRLSETLDNLDFLMTLFSSDVIFPSTNRRFVCMPPGINRRRLTQLGFYTSNSGTRNYSALGCVDREVYDYFLIYYAGGGAWADNFPGEYRRNFNLNSWKANIPDGYTAVSARVVYYRAIPIGSYQTRTYNIPLETYAGGDSMRLTGLHNLVKNDGFLTGGSALMYVYPTLEASCETPEATYIEIDEIANLGYEQDQFDNLYPDSIDVNNESELNIRYYPPQLNIIASVPTADAIEKKAEWTLNFQNNAPTGRHAENTWFYYNDLSGGQIIMDSLIIGSTVILPDSNGFFQLGSLNAGSIKTYSAFASYTNCDVQCVEWMAGYNCSEYFGDIDDAINAMGCEPLRDTICVNPITALLQATEIMAPDSGQLCESLDFEYEFVNVQTGHSYNNVVEIIIPLESEVDISSIELEFPSGSGYTSATSGITFIAPNTYIIELDSTFNTMISDGLSGGLDPSANSFKIKYEVLLGCTYISNSQFKISAYGENSCGSPTNKTTAPVKTVGVNGVPEPYFINPRLMVEDDVNVCDDGLLYSINLLKLGSNLTGNLDSLVVTLPSGFTYQPLSFNGIHNPPTHNNPNVKDIGTITQLWWKLPAGVTALDSMYFTIKLDVDTSIACGTFESQVQTVVDYTSYCITTMSNCGVKAQTGNKFVNFDVQRPELSFSNLSFVSNPISSSQEEITITYTLVNSGKTKTAGDTISVDLTYDINLNNSVDISDTYQSTYNITDEILAGDSMTYTYIDTVSSSTSCALFVSIAKEKQPNANCLCTETEATALTQLNNAGVDTFVCSTLDVQIGEDPLVGHSYAWTPTTNLNNPNVSNPTFSVENTSLLDVDYTLVLETTRGSSCTTYDTVVVTVIKQPVVTISSATDTVCTMQTAILNATSDFISYTWTHLEEPLEIYPDSSDIEINIATVGSGIHRYSVVSVDSFGCIGIDTFQFYVSQTPNGPISNGDESICISDPIPSLSVIVSSGNTANWYDAQTGGNLLSMSSTSYTPASLIVGSNCYWVEEANSYQTCLSERIQICIDADAAPIVNAGPDISLIGDQFYSMQANISGGTGMWNQIGGASIIIASTNPTAVINLTEGNIYIFEWIGTNGNCEIIDTVTITVIPANNPPVAANNDTTTSEDSPVVIDVVGNDFDIDGAIDSSSIAVVTGPTNGTITAVNPDGTFEYTPDPNFVGTDMFTYLVCDDGMPVLCDTATVTITIEPLSDTVYVSVPEDSMVTICTDNSVNFENPITSVSLCENPEEGTTSPNVLPCIDYSPDAGYVGQDTMCLVTCAGTVCDTTIVVVTVGPVNDPPVAANNDTTTSEDSPVVIDVVGNDFDIDGAIDSSSIAVVTGPTNGTITAVNPDGTFEYTPDPNFVGTDMFTYLVCDDGMPVLCDTATVTITIEPLSDTVYVSVPEDSMVTICTDNSVNFENPITSVSLCENPEEGTTSPNVLPCIDYSPDAGYVGQDTMCLVTCAGTVCDTTIVVVTVGPVNDPPVAANNDTTTSEDSPVVIDVVGNDFDIDGAIDSSSIAVVTGPTNGTITAVNPDGTFEYTPDPNFVGTDMFTYLVCDDGMPVLCDTATVTITIEPLSDTIYVSVPEDSMVTICTDNSVNFENPITSVSLCENPEEGTTSPNVLPCIDYSPDAGYVGQDTMCLVTCAGTVCDTTIVVVTVGPVNDPPVAANNDTTTSEDSPVVIDVVGNDFDIDGAIDSSSIAVVTGPTNGTITAVNPDGTFEYTPDPNFVGTDMFTYLVCDDGMPVLCDTATVTITIEPLSDTVYVSVPEDSMVTICTDNSVNFENPITSVSLCENPEEGTTSPNVLPCIDYSPDAGYVGQDTMCLVTCAGTVCDTTIVVVTVGPVNDPPVAANNDTTTSEDSPVVIDVVGNDFDIDGAIDSSSIAVVTGPTNGTITAVNPDGTFEYTPDPNFVGTDMFTYLVCDDGMPVLCDTATVTITIEPLSDTVYVSVPEDSMVTICTDNSVNFENPITSVSLCENPEEGTTSPNVLPCIDYSPDAGYVGQDTMCLVTCAGTVCDTTIVVVTVGPVNDPPVAANNDTTTSEDSPVVIDVVGNDFDIDGAIDSSSIAVVTGPTNGTITAVNPDGTFEYTPDPNFVGTDMFTYLVCDDGMPVLCDTATVTITIEPLSDTIYVSVPEDSMVTICTDNSVNFENPITSVSLCENPEEGTTSPNVLPCIDYSPDAGYVGQDTMCLVTCAGTVCDTTIVVIEVSPVNDPPVALNNDTTTSEDSPVTINLVDNDNDNDGNIDSTSVVIIGGPTNGVITSINPDGTVEYTPNPGYAGVDEFTYIICDDGIPVLCDTAIATITISSSPDTTFITVPEDSMVSVCTDSLTNFAGPIENIFTCGNPQNGSISPSFLPCIDYSPDAGYIGPDTVCLVTCAGIVCDTTIIVIEVTPVNDPPVAANNDTTISEDSPVVIDVVGNDFDIDGAIDSSSIAVVTGPTNGTITAVNPDGTFEYTPDPNFVGTDMFTYLVCDDGMPVLCDTATVTITIEPVSDTIMVTLPEDSMITVCTDNSVNFENPITSVSLCDNPEEGTTTPSILPCIEYTPNLNYYGPDTMCIVTCAGIICDTTIVVIDVTPVVDAPTLVPIDDICATEPIPTLMGTTEPHTTINWFDANNVLIGTGNMITPTSVDSGVLNCYYAVSVHDTIAVSSDTVEVCFQVDAVPMNVYAGPDDTICGFQDYELQAMGNGLNTYWTQIIGNSVGLSSSNPNAIVTLEPLNAPGLDNLYTFVWTNSNGLCVVEDTVNIVVTNPHITFAGNDTTVCIPQTGGSVNLNAILTPTATGYWDCDGCPNISYADSTDPNTLVSGLVPYSNPTSTYLFYWFEQIGDCIARDEVVITVNETPGLSVSPEDTSCLGSEIILDANINGISQASYSWREDSPTGNILSWDEDAIVSPTVNTVYYVVANVAFGQNFCSAIDSVEIFVNGAPIAIDDGCYTVSEDDVLLGSTSDWSVNDDYTAIFGNGDVGFVVVTESTLDPGSTLSIDNATGEYTYTPHPNMSGVDTAFVAVYNKDCPSLLDTFRICFDVLPVDDGQIVAVDDLYNVPVGSTTDFDITINDALNDDAIETIITVVTDPLFGSAEPNGTFVEYAHEEEYAAIDSFEYVVCQYMDDNEELCDTAWVVIYIDGDLIIPEGFTPNGDGVNDAFEIPNLTLLYPEATLSIFNRWGDEVWNSQGPYKNDWTGLNFNETQLPDGTYFYIINLNDNDNRKMASYVVVYR